MTDKTSITTDRVVRYVLETEPDRAALHVAESQRDSFVRAGGRAPEALTTHSTDDPLWTAWVSGAAAAHDSNLTWVAVTAAATALCDDERAVTAIALGRGVAELVAAALGDKHAAEGWDMRATAGTVGAVAATGRLCGLDSDQLRNAIGLAATQAAGLLAAAGTDAEAIQVGKAAANAVEAALLAECGFTSSAAPLEGRRGLLALMTDRPAEALQV